MKNSKPNINLQESFKKVFIDAATEVNEQYSYDAGRLLQNGDGSVMSTYRTIKQSIEKMKK